MADQQEQSNTTEPEQQDAVPSADAQSTGSVPYDRFKSVNEEKKALETQLAELKAAEEKRQADADAIKKKQLEEQNKFQELYEAAELEKATASQSLEEAKARLQVMETALNAQWGSQKELIPEVFRSLVEAMPIESRITWLSENADKLTEQRGNGTPRRQAQKSITPPQQNGRVPSLPSFKF